MLDTFTRRRASPQMATEQARREAAERDRAELDLLQALPAAIYTTDADGRLELYNQAAVDLWGRQPERGDRWCGALRAFTPEGAPLARKIHPWRRRCAP
jgi:PAS domain-containing protein